MRRATLDDIPTLLRLMSEFYAESGFELNCLSAETAFSAILADERLGHVWLIDDDSKDVGYLVLVLRFGMEFGGLIGCIDDLFVAPDSRKKGLGSAALIQARDFCKENGVLAISVEVGFTNHPAQAVYRRLGMAEASDRQLLVLPLASPIHKL